MCGKAAKIVLTETQQSELQKNKRSSVCSQRLIQRVSIILLAFDGMLNQQIAYLGHYPLGSWLTCEMFRNSNQDPSKNGNAPNSPHKGPLAIQLPSSPVRLMYSFTNEETLNTPHIISAAADRERET